MFVAALCATTALGLEAPEAKVSVRIVGEDGLPIPQAAVTIGFEVPKPPAQGWGTVEKPAFGLTNEQGEWSATGPSSGHLGGNVKKEGFYDSYFAAPDFSDVREGKWQPWNPTVSVLLKKIVNPVPMYARRVRIELPAVDQPIGYDLIAGDWIAPYGKGTVSDFVVTVQKTFNTRKDYDSNLRLTFSNPDDGIQSVKFDFQHGSFLRLPRIAPESGYESAFHSRLAHTSDSIVDERQKDRSLIFRVRAVAKNGKIKSALYGKILGDIGFDVVNSKTAVVFFTYYLNPDGTRNLEFDPKSNLFSELKPMEKVSEP